MRVRMLLVLTAIASSLLGGVVTYLVLSVPNDLDADAMLKQARQRIAAGDNEKAGVALRNIVQQYPRTDAAAAATVALVTIADEERRKLDQELERVKKEADDQKKQIDALTQQVTQIANAPPKTVIVEAPPKKAPVKKTTTKKTTSRKRRRR